MMEKKNLKLKNNFTQLISQVSKLYKDVSNTGNEAYLLGKKEAFEEVLNWFITSHNGELKYISANSFFNMIQEKITKTKTALATKTSEDAGEEEIKQQVNFSDIKISDNRKRVNRYALVDSNTNNYGYSNNNDQIVVEDESNISSVSASQISFPFSVSSLINPNSGNSFLINQNSSANTQINSLNTDNSANDIPLNNSTNNLNFNTESSSNNTNTFTSINSIGQINNQANNIFGNSQSQNNPFLLPAKKKKK